MPDPTYEELLKDHRGLQNSRKLFLRPITNEPRKHNTRQIPGVVNAYIRSGDLQKAKEYIEKIK